MKIRNVSHIAVGVRDMDRSLAFYRDVLGLHVSLDAIEELPSIAGSPPLRRRGVYLRWREGSDESFI
ncbi:VOC family protein, partial [Myxococcota bacterium]|nr:VOC family protein [Myxococcota bacterium]